MSTPVEIRDCKWPWNWLYVHLNGDVKPCCYATFPVANLNDRGTNLHAVWAGPRMEEVRTAVKANQIHRVCAGAGCSYIRSRFPDDASAWAVFEVPEGVVEEHTSRLASMGQRNAAYIVGVALEAKGRLDEAFVWMERAAEGNEHYALHWLATRQLTGGSKYNPAKAVACLERAVADQYTPAITMLARCCQLGTGTPVDVARAVELYRLAAERGDAAAWCHLGDCYRDGVGVPRDVDEARRHYQTALRRGSAEAQILLDALTIPVAADGVDP